MIKGLTHDLDTGVINRIVKFKGKINTGYAPKEPPNQKNSPVPCGFFRFMKQVVKTEMVNGAKVQYQDWVLDPLMQKQLQEACKGATEPRKIEAICMNAVQPADMWESFMGRYSKTDGLICKSYGKGTKVTHVVYEGDKRSWQPRLFNGVCACPYDECPDYKKGECKENGIMHVYPLQCDRMNPYQFSTRSKNTILAIESALDTMYNTMASIYCLANNVKQLGPDFRGLESLTYSLVHKKIKSGGKDVFVSQIEFSDEFSAFAMGMIRTYLQANQKLMMNQAKLQITGSADEAMTQQLHGVEQVLIEGNRNPALDGLVEDDDDGDVPMTGTVIEPEAEAEITAAAVKAAAGTKLDAAAASLLGK